MCIVCVIDNICQNQHVFKIHLEQKKEYSLV